MQTARAKRRVRCVADSKAGYLPDVPINHCRQADETTAAQSVGDTVLHTWFGIVTTTPRTGTDKLCAAGAGGW